jgi:thiamine-phosphate diphosphorylase / hydroxyethylthiazole kinase
LNSQTSKPNICTGVTIVQYRSKHGDTEQLLSEAAALLRITRQHNVPLIINDRVDIALAVGADGIHVGQEDLGEQQASVTVQG